MVVKVALAGIGSCASSLVQLAASADRAADQAQPLPGVAHPEVAGIAIGDLEFVAAFDVDKGKVGLDLRDAALSDANAAKRFVHVAEQGVVVSPGPLADGLEGRLGETIQPHADAHTVGVADVADVLADSRADVLLCYLPTGAIRGVQAYAEGAAQAAVGFVNATPEPVACDPYFQRLFVEAGAPLLGDDAKSMLGATAVHGALIELFQSKGIALEGTYQLNVGGNKDFYNLADHTRAASKVASKRAALSAEGIPAADVLAGPNGFAEYLGDSKVCHVSLLGRSVLGSSVEIELRLRVEDSPNSAGVMIDAVRIAGAARWSDLKGVVAEPCAMLFKNPPIPMPYSESVRRFEQFITSLPQ